MGMKHSVGGQASNVQCVTRLIASAEFHKTVDHIIHPLDSYECDIGFIPFDDAAVLAISGDMVQ